MIYKTVVWKTPNDVHIPDNEDRTTFNTNHNNWRTDFETNYKSQCLIVTDYVSEDTEISYDEFKTLVTTQGLDFTYVLLYETDIAYFLFIEV